MIHYVDMGINFSLFSVTVNDFVAHKPSSMPELFMNTEKTDRTVLDRLKVQVRCGAKVLCSSH